MIRPQSNAFRLALDLSGIWSLMADPDGAGEDRGWPSGLPAGSLQVAVPGSWNEQLAEDGLLNYVGDVWFQKRFVVPDTAHECAELYLGSADYYADVWLDGEWVGESQSPMLPFRCDVSGTLVPGREHCLIVRVSNLLRPDGAMMGVTEADYAAEGRTRDAYFPPVRFDFFPFGGLSRAVCLSLLPALRLTEVRIDTGTLDPSGGWVEVSASASAPAAFRVRIGETEISGRTGDTLRLELPGLPRWSPHAPVLHDLCVDLVGTGAQVTDSVSYRVGLRSLTVKGHTVLLNGEPIRLKGFGKHEDTSIAGRGVNLPVLIKDFGLLKWCGANSVRTSHYPYDETFLDLADERGILVISEIFSVNLDFRKVSDTTYADHVKAIEAQFARDRHHACVIAWSLSNEPGYLGEAAYEDRSRDYWRDLFAHARLTDPTRPLTVANVQYAGLEDPALRESDFLSVNRYFGWYSEPGQIDRAVTALDRLLTELGNRHGKPVFVSEFGADAIAGFHSTTDQLWTEEYQADLIAAYWEVIENNPNCAGGHVWNFADFRTAQHGRRAVMNRKGVFTRERDPKRAAFVLRSLWKEQDDGQEI